MRKRIYILAVLTVILVLAVGSCRKAGTWLVKDDQVRHADVMVMLTGSISDRVLQTVDLYSEGVATRVWIVEEGMGANRALEARGVKLISNSTQVKNAMITLGIPSDSIRIVPGDAASTRMEAEIVRSYLRTQTGMDTLLLVTSSEHTRRAYKIFKAAFKNPEDLPVVYCSASKYTNFHPEKWWRSKEDIQEVVNEYMKLTNFVFFERGELRND